RDEPAAVSEGLERLARDRRRSHLAVLREGDASERGGLGAARHGRPGREVPDDDDSVRVARCHLLAVLGERDGADRRSMALEAAGGLPVATSKTTSDPWRPAARRRRRSGLTVSAPRTPEAARPTTDPDSMSWIASPPARESTATCVESILAIALALSVPRLSV